MCEKYDSETMSQCCCGNSSFEDNSSFTAVNSGMISSSGTQQEFSSGAQEVSIADFDGAITINPDNAIEDVTIKLDCDINESGYTIKD